MKTLGLLQKCSYIKDETQKVGIQLQEIIALNCNTKKGFGLAIRKNFLVIRTVKHWNRLSR